MKDLLTLTVDAELLALSGDPAGFILGEIGAAMADSPQFDFSNLSGQLEIVIRELPAGESNG